MFLTTQHDNIVLSYCIYYDITMHSNQYYCYMFSMLCTWTEANKKHWHDTSQQRTKQTIRLNNYPLILSCIGDLLAEMLWMTRLFCKTDKAQSYSYRNGARTSNTASANNPGLSQHFSMSCAMFGMHNSDNYSACSLFHKSIPLRKSPTQDSHWTIYNKRLDIDKNNIS